MATARALAVPAIARGETVDGVLYKASKKPKTRGELRRALAPVVAGWIAPVLICASVLLIGRSFYVIYVKNIRTRTTVVVAWCALVFMVSFWTVYLTVGGW